MTKKWITDVIEDLSGFARQNFMPKLSEQLDFAHAIARAEIMEHRVAHEEAKYGNTHDEETFSDPVQAIRRHQHLQSGSSLSGHVDIEEEKQRSKYPQLV